MTDNTLFAAPGIRNHVSRPGYRTAVLLVVALPALYFISRYNYNLFHSVVDGASIVIAASVFTIIWNTRHMLDNEYFLYIGISFLFFAFLDSMHVLGNKNMGVFPEHGNLGPALYIASRYMLGLSLLIAPLFINRKLNSALMFVAYSLVTLFILLSIFYWRIFPVCIVEGVGLTPFKVISDYIVCLILLGAIGLLLINRRLFDPRVFRIIVSAIILSIATGVAFTLYADPFGIMNAVGHFFQIASFYLFYLAMIETSLTRPQDVLYRKLKQSEEKLSENVKQLDYANVELKQEIAERRRAEQALRLSEAKFRSIFETNVIPIAYCHMDGRILDANGDYLKLVGFTREELAAGEVRWDVLTPPEWKQTDEAALVHLRRDGVCPPLEKEYLRRDGTRVPVLLGACTVPGDPEQVIAFAVDLTERKAMEEALRKSRDGFEQRVRERTVELESRNQELQDFVFVASHDLNEPLRKIQTFGSLLEAKRGYLLDEQSRDYVSRMSGAANWMRELLDALLRYSRVDKEGQAFRPTKLDDVVRDAVADLAAAIRNADAHVEIKPLPTVTGEPHQLRQLFQNLLANALKYQRPEGKPRLRIFGEEGNGACRVFVEDNGIGFDEKYLEKIFQPFQRLHGADEYSGIGMGLALCRKIVERHRGIITAKSTPGKGSVFMVTLPVDGGMITGPPFLIN